MKLALFFSFTFLVLGSQAQINSLLKKGSRAAGKNKLDKAYSYYMKAYELDKNNYKSNLGLGVTLSEYMGKHEEAIPYLEKAYLSSPKDTSIDLIYALGKSYHHIGEYQKALLYYHKLDGTIAIEDDDKEYQMDISKRHKDCEYALNNLQNTATDFYILNIGKNINTPMAEYVPVIYADSTLIFTSRRQDSPKEKVNPLDGKYFESMYASTLNNGRPQSVRRYTVPDLYLKSQFKKGHESVISISPDGKTLYLFKNAKIYEVKTDAIKKEKPKKLSKSVNFDYYQSHAYLSKDGNTLLFTSEAKGGEGGIDIYKSIKTNNVWSTPVNLGKTINTPYDEDAPYLSDDGQILYFASKGHPGYGNYDIYKSTYENGAWSKPQNLGLPVNSPAHDIFLIQQENTTTKAGYFSSSRIGGQGDMDIYKINYIKDLKKECLSDNSPLLSIKSKIINEQNGEITCELKINNEALKIYSLTWSLNNNILPGQTPSITTIINPDGKENTVGLKLIAYCDTCFEPLALCNTAKITVGKKEEVLTENDIVKNQYDPNLEYTYLNKKKLKELGFDLTPIHFDLNKSDLRLTEHQTLNKNIEILLQNKDLGILIYGFADSRGEERFNEILSRKRANKVKNYLLQKGVKESQIKLTNGKGERFLTNDCVNEKNCDDIQHEQNRRVEFLIFEN